MRAGQATGVVLLAASCSFPGAQPDDGNGEPDAAATTDASGETDSQNGVSERTLQFTNPTPTNIGDAPILVRLRSDCIDYARAGDNGESIRFFEDSDELAHEIERWDPSGESLVWVSFPLVGSNATETLTLRFGDVPAATRVPTEVWSRYAAVWHLAEAGDALLNSASDLYPGASTNTNAEPAALIGTGRAFTAGAASDITFGASDGLLSGWDLLTYEVWLRPTYQSDGAWPSSVGEGDEYFGTADGVPTGGFVLYRSGSADGHGWADSRVTFDDRVHVVSTEVANKQWNHLAITVKGDNSGGNSDAHYFLNGQRIAQRALSNNVLATSTTDFFLGGANGFDGTVDELRIANERRSDSYIRFGFEAANDPTFVTCQ